MINVLLKILSYSLFFVLLVAVDDVPGTSWQETARKEIVSLPHPHPKRVSLLFAGDIMGHQPQIEAARIVENLHYDYHACFEPIQSLVRAADIAIANLELTLPGIPPFSGYPLFRSPDALAIALRNAGFDLMLTANNHSNDAGQLGVYQTINTLYKYGFYQTGSFQSQAERSAYYPLIIYKNGIKLAFLNYTFSTNGLKNTPPTIVNLIDTTQIKVDMAQAKAMQPDFIVAAMHWGWEYHLQENVEQRNLASQLVKWGADLVVGAHPHVVQPIKFYNREGREDSRGAVPVAFSLGNLISNQQKQHTDGGILLEVELVKDPSNKSTHISEIAYMPVWRYIKEEPNGKKTFMTIPVQAYKQNQNGLLVMRQADRKKMEKFASLTRSRLSKYGVKEKSLSHP